MEGFYESMLYELEPTNITLKLIEPGAINTPIYDKGRLVFIPPKPDQHAYQPFYKKVWPFILDGLTLKNPHPPEMVAKVLYQAATDGKNKFRYMVGMDVKSVAFLRWSLPFNWFKRFVKRIARAG